MRHKRKPAEGEPEPVACRDCKKIFERPGEYKPVADGVICKDRPSCRSRQLSRTLGIDLFTQYPRERTVYEMDVRPDNYKDIGWEPVFTEDERVMAGWIYYSWTYPICMPYAVQINADDEIMYDRYGNHMVMTRERLAAILGIQQPNMVRATQRLEARKKLRFDDGRVYPVAKPLLSARERKDIRSDIFDRAGEYRSSVPPQYRQPLSEILSEAPEDIRSDILARVDELCSAFNEAVKDARSTRNLGIEQVCIATASLLSRPVTFRVRAGVSPSVATDARPPASLPPGADDPEPPDHLPVPLVNGHAQAEALYNGIPRLQQRYPNAPFAQPPFNALGKADRQFTLKILAALQGSDATEFLEYVDGLFRGGRSPYDSGGPRKLGLLIDWAGDFARGAEARAEQRAKCAPLACWICDQPIGDDGAAINGAHAECYAERAKGAGA